MSEMQDAFEVEWYPVKDSDSYASVRCKVILHEAHGMQELWLVPQTSHSIAEHISHAHNEWLKPKVPDAPEGYRHELVRTATADDPAPQ